MAVVTLIMQRTHLLIALLALEGIILTLILLIIVTFTHTNLFLCIVLLTIGACEARLGLACLVLIIRSSGTDRISSLTSMKC